MLSSGRAKLVELGAPLFDAFLDLFLRTLVGWFVVAFGRAEVILRHEMIGVRVGVFVTDSVSQLFRAFVMGVPQVLGDGQGSARANIFEGGIDRTDGSVALVGSGDVNGGLGERNSRFRPADKFRGVMRGSGQDQSHGIGEAYIFSGADH